MKLTVLNPLPLGRITIAEQRERAEHAELSLLGKRFRISNRLASVLGQGNEAGYIDFHCGLPPCGFSPSDDQVYVTGYTSGYKRAEKGKVPQCVWLRTIGFRIQPEQ